jgi:hypothetical protein
MKNATATAASKSTTDTAKSKPGPKPKGDAVSLLKADHRKAEQIFAQYEQSEDEQQKRQLARQVCLELIVHTKLEEEIFYPACREKQVDSDLLDEAQVEHDSAKLLIADLLRGEPGDEYYDAKVTTLSEYIKHHVSEEEQARSGIFAKAQKAGVDMAGLGQQIQARKMELMSQSEALCSRPPQPRSIHVQPQQPKSQEDYSMARNSNDRDRDERGRFTDDDDNRGSRGGYQSRSSSSGRERDDQGRFMSDDDDRGRGSSRGGSSRSRGDDDDGGRGRGHGGWFGDSEGHSQAAREGWDDRGSSRSRGYDDDDRGGRSRGSSGGGGRGQGGWFGDSEGHSEASRRGWEHSSHEGSGWYGDPRGHSEASRRGWQNSDHEGSGWYGDPQGHSQASREGWEDRGSSRSSRGRDDDDRGSSRGGRGGGSGGRGQGGWFGDSEGHSQASREGWRNR